MAKTDIHREAFDEGTKAKLELLRLYIRGWLPVFISDTKVTYPNIEIYDFFAGEGQDSIDTHGSPLIILNEMKTYCADLVRKRIRLTILFNDANNSKYLKLNTSKDNFLIKCAQNKKFGFCMNENGLPNCPFSIKLENSDFTELFNSLNASFKSNLTVPRFMFIDQYGIKQVTKKVFQDLVSLAKTDFLFFISSSYLKRFKELPEFKKYIDDNQIDFSDTKPTQCHRVVFQYFKRLVNKEPYFLGQFSIKKGSNVYGLIFGSNSHLGMRKFLDVAWKMDPFTGEANHDIDDDSIRTGQLSLNFDNSANKIKKLYFYEQNLMEFLRNPKLNKEVYVYSLEQGVNIPKTNEILRRLEKEQRIIAEGQDRQKGAFYLDYNPDKQIKIRIK
jgi:three-Cys-motif partner protein